MYYVICIFEIVCAGDLRISRHTSAQSPALVEKSFTGSFMYRTVETASAQERLVDFSVAEQDLIDCRSPEQRLMR